jgi:hypothetical protein
MRSKSSKVLVVDGSRQLTDTIMERRDKCFWNRGDSWSLSARYPLAAIVNDTLILNLKLAEACVANGQG